MAMLVPAFQRTSLHGFLLGTYPGMKLLGHRLYKCSILRRNAKQFYKVFVKLPLFLAVTLFLLLAKESKVSRIFNVLQVSWNKISFYKHYLNEYKVIKEQGLNF